LGEGDDNAAFAVEAAPGSAAKNSLASFAIAAGSGTADIKAETPWYFFVPSSCAASGVEDDVGASVATRSLVLVILIDIDALQHADCIIRKDRNRAIERNQI
jgi:hypothetical protein